MTSQRSQAVLLALACLLGLVVVIATFRRTTPPAPDPQPAVTSETPKADPVALYRPTVVPDRIILTFASDPATSQAVTWRTDTTVKAPVAEFALAADGPVFEKGWRGYDEKLVKRLAARTERLTADGHHAHYHSVNFTDLAPKTKYVYRVGDGSNWSEWFQFETASKDPEPFGFIYFGDAQNGIRSLWSRVARGAYSDMPKARFIVHAGDLVDAGNSDPQWGEWHAAAGWINGMVPSVPAPGNHEYSDPKGITRHWRPQFTLPEHGPEGLTETCYFLDYQGVRVVVLNSNEKHAEQAAWLEKTLATNPNRWTVVTFHHPFYSPVAGRDNPAVREAWRKVFDAVPKGVDLVLQGHDHTYGRSGLMREDNRLDGTQVQTARGTVYVVSVSGAKLYTGGDLTWMKRRGSGAQLYQLIRVEGDELVYESRTARGDLYDAFRLKKRADGGNDLIEGENPPGPEGPSGPDTPAVAGGNGGGVGARGAWNAVVAVVILALVALAVGWAVRGR
ncbi:metallophosphoesterase family protein [bacterium]|nr:metallophosphoesterase family protein [bacterium]